MTANFWDSTLDGLKACPNGMLGTRCTRCFLSLRPTLGVAPAIGDPHFSEALPRLVVGDRAGFCVWPIRVADRGQKAVHQRAVVVHAEVQHTARSVVQSDYTTRRRICPGI